ncbi:MAG: 2,5-diamino-6-(ribosylamino)-4(3H)-pyrimidinone 5'-phosphate reductase [Promethearchaeota archaeon]
MERKRETFPVLKERPYTIYNCAMSLDGKTSTIGQDSSFSGKNDWVRVHELRDSVDGICVGINTVLVDDPKLRVKFIDNPKNPDRIVIDSRLRVPVDAQLVNFQRENVNAYVGTTEHAIRNNPTKVKVLKEKNVKIISCGAGKRVDIKVLWNELKKKGINSILLEGGGTVAASMFKERLIDEVRVYVAPFLVGGTVPPAASIIAGIGYKKVEDSIRLSLVKLAQLDDGIYARFLIKY